MTTLDLQVRSIPEISTLLRGDGFAAVVLAKADEAGSNSEAEKQADQPLIRSPNGATCTYTYLLIDLSIYRSIYRSIHLLIYLSICPSIYLYLYLSICVHVYMYTIYIYICTYYDMYVCVYIYIDRYAVYADDVFICLYM